MINSMFIFENQIEICKILSLFHICSSKFFSSLKKKIEPYLDLVLHTAAKSSWNKFQINNDFIFIINTRLIVHDLFN